jgi:hypothetical protein
MQTQEQYLAQLEQKRNILMESIEELKDIDSHILESINKNKEDLISAKKDLESFKAESGKRAISIFQENEDMNKDIERSLKKRDTDIKEKELKCSIIESKNKDDKKKLEEDKQELYESLISIDSKYEELVEKEESLKKRIADVVEKESETNTSRKAVKALEQVSQDKLSRISTEYKNMEEERDEFLALTKKEERVLSIRKKRLETQEEILLEREEQVKQDKIWIADRKAMLMNSK